MNSKDIWQQLIPRWQRSECRWQLSSTTPFFVSFWPLDKTFVHIRHIGGATNGRLVTKNHHCAKLFGDLPLQLDIGRMVQHCAKQIVKGRNYSSYAELAPSMPKSGELLNCFADYYYYYHYIVYSTNHDHRVGVTVEHCQFQHVCSCGKQWWLVRLTVHCRAHTSTLAHIGWNVVISCQCLLLLGGTFSVQILRHSSF